MVHFILPAACTIALVALPVYLAFLWLTYDVLVARSALTLATVLFCDLSCLLDQRILVVLRGGR